MILPFQEFLDSLLVRHAGGRRRRGARAPCVLGRRGLVWRRRDAAIVARRGSRVCHLHLLLRQSPVVTSPRQHRLTTVAEEAKTALCLRVTRSAHERTPYHFGNTR